MLELAGVGRGRGFCCVQSLGDLARRFLTNPPCLAVESVESQSLFEAGDGVEALDELRS